jgi:hypothetical protein
MEDFTTYTEVDPDSDLTVSATKIEASSVSGSVDASVYKDFGAGNLTDLHHEFRCKLATGSGPVACIVWAISNVAAGSYSEVSLNGEIISILVKGGKFNIGIEAPPLGGASWNPEGYLDTDLYITVVRKSTTTTVYIYSDSARKVLVHSMSVTTDGAAYRYLNAFGSAETGAPGSATLEVGDYAIKPITKAQATMII